VGTKKIYCPLQNPQQLKSNITEFCIRWPTQSGNTLEKGLMTDVAMKNQYTISTVMKEISISSVSYTYIPLTEIYTGSDLYEENVFM
jgi:hypothetical protein